MSYHHDLNLRVYYEDTDAGNVVYHASYLRFAARGRTETQRDLGYSHTQMKEDGILFVVRHQEIDYKQPARLDDLISIRTTIQNVGKSSITLKQIIKRDNDTLAEILTTVVCVNDNGRATRVPQKALEIFTKAL